MDAPHGDRGGTAGASTEADVATSVAAMSHLFTSRLVLAHGLLEQRTSALLEEHGVTHLQYRILMLLDGEPTALADLEHYTNDVARDEDETPAGTLAELADSGWVAGDASAYSLTERGGEALVHLGASFSALRETLLGGVSADDEQTAEAVLLRLAQNLGYTEET